eukprot:4424483-Pyramimonas_sp.AAC.1
MRLNGVLTNPPHTSRQDASVYYASAKQFHGLIGMHSTFEQVLNLKSKLFCVTVHVVSAGYVNRHFNILIDHLRRMASVFPVAET